MNNEDLIAGYVALRDKIGEIKKRHEAELSQYTSVIEEMESRLLVVLEAAGAESIRTNAGTAYKANWSSARVSDWSQTLEYILANERYDLLERRVAKAVVEEIGDVPGVVVERGVRVNVRRA